MPEIGRLRTVHPALTLEIVTGIALRMVKPERGNVSLRRLGVLGYGLYG